MLLSLFFNFNRNLLKRKTTLFLNMLVSFLVWTLIQNLVEFIQKLLDAVLIKNKVFRIHLTDSKVLVNFMMINNSMILLDLLFSGVMERKLYFLLILHIKRNGVLVFAKLIWNLIQGQKLLQILRHLSGSLNLIIQWERGIVRKLMHQDSKQIINFVMEHLGQLKRILTQTLFDLNTEIDIISQNLSTRL